MELALLVYVISQLGTIKHTVGALFLLSTIATIVSGIVWKVGYSSPVSWHQLSDGTPKPSWLAEQKNAKDIFKVAAIILSITLPLNVLLPSERTAYLMVGAYTAQKVAQNDKVNEMSGKVMKIIESKVDSYVQELEPKMKEQK
jgi:hypothetical protein